MPFALKGWEVGSVFPSLNSVFGVFLVFFCRSGFLVVCMGTPLLTVQCFALKKDVGLFLYKKKKKRKENIQYFTLGSPEDACTWLL